MKKYQIVEISENHNHAGTKATQDITEIADQLGYERVMIRMNTTKKTKLAKVQRQIGYRKDWAECLKKVEENAVILLQHPFHYPQLTREKTLMELKEKKHVKFVSLIHDVEELRAFRYNDYYKGEFDFMLRIADVWIVHNAVMKQFFIECGVPEEKIVTLGIFDYLQSGNVDRKPQFERSITVAGNLDTEKCGYVGQLGQLSGVQVKLFGMNYDKKMDQCENVRYYGSFPTDEIPGKLTGGFGLVWDGAGIDGCIGQSGQYLRYNNPHKLSLYLSSGLPVIIWKEAAEAAFVKTQGVGICVESLKELSTIFEMLDENTYNGYAEAAQVLSEKLRTGQFGRKAIRTAEDILGL